MDQTDPSRDPLRSLAETALARQEAAQRQRADDQAAVDRDPDGVLHLPAGGAVVRAGAAGRVRPELR